jgi:beta-lactamase class A
MNTRKYRLLSMGEALAATVLAVLLLVVLAGCETLSPPADQSSQSGQSGQPDSHTSPQLQAATSGTIARPSPIAVVPSPTPSPTPVPTFPLDSHIAGVDVGGLSVEGAEKEIHTRLLSHTLPLTLSIPSPVQASLVITPSEIDLALSSDGLKNLLAKASTATRPFTTPMLPVRYNRAAMQRYVADFAEQVALSPTLHVLIETGEISRTFAYTPALVLDVEQAMQQVDQWLTQPHRPRLIPITLTADFRVPTPTVSLEQIRQQAEAMADEWEGIVGFYLYDLASGETVAINENTVFSGASVMKAAILFQAYVELQEFTEKQRENIHKMIVESDNLAANYVLAAAASGTGTEDALVGANMMNDLLREHLGLQHTYQYMPYEASDYLIKVRGMKIKRGPPQEGDPPYTEADPMLRTTPAEMSQVFLEIDQCSKGQGELMQTFTATLTMSRCQEMLDLLAENGDHERMRAGIPDGVRVEHKSGWIEDMQSDVGIVRSPGGDFILAIYLYRETDWLRDYIAQPALAGFARMVYTAYNPVRLPLDAQSDTRLEVTSDE